MQPAGHNLARQAFLSSPLIGCEYMLQKCQKL